MKVKQGDEGSSDPKQQQILMPSFDDDAIDEVKNGLAELEKRVKELKEQKVESEQYDIDVYKINQRLDKLENLKPSKATSAATSTRVDTRQSDFDSDLFDRLNSRLDQTEKMLTDNRDQANNQIDLLRLQISDLQKKTLNIVTEDGLRKIVLDVGKLTDDSKDIWSDIKQIKTQLNEMSEIKRKLSVLSRLPNEADFNQLKKRVDLIENINNNFKRRMDDFDKRVKILEAKVTGAATAERPTTEDHSSEDSLRVIVEGLERDLKSFREFQSKENLRFTQELATKVSFDDLLISENRIFEQVTDLIKQWASKFFSKEELNKRFNIITRKIREEGGR